MTAPIHVSFDFTKPEDARKFLGGLRTSDGIRQVTCVQVVSGERKDFSSMGDEEAMETADQLFFEWYERGLVIWEVLH